MSYTNIRKKTEGFTIIEVLIVLAIAGLIMMVVFLAVPALQRNSRNTQRKSDISAYAGAVKEWSNNNNGRTPTTAADATAINTLVTMSTLTPSTAAPTAGTAAQTAVLAMDTIQVVRGAKCDTTNVGNTTANGPARAIAIRYTIENAAGAPVMQCIEV